jgi:menaquinone-dependent protoporphyrinogen IX oxidase
VGKKCLITYSSFSGNTEKVALRFKKVFDSRGWQVDVFKVRKNADDILRPPYDLRKYDFVCAGSGLRSHLPYNEVLNMLRGFRTGLDPRFTLSFRDENIAYITEPMAEFPPDKKDPRNIHHKMVVGPQSPKAVVFITYAGYEFGAIEAEPAAQILGLELMHIGYLFMGSFCCPGRYLNDPTPRTFYGDIRDRPNEKDLLRAEMFIEEKLEAIIDRPV